ALDVIREMARVEGAVVGAGTVLTPDDVKASLDAGARFLVSPGLTDRLANAAIGTGLPFLPGTANAGDIMRGLDMGLTHFKFFPAMANGGIPALKALAAPLAAARFCPTGGITEDNARDWLALDAVLCVGGSWIVPAGKPDIAEIVKRAKAAAKLKA
ncbi:bifunctional 4-hydroxy-2-oxoglutarate aldolase/2-dehydro-3-deoxy-phosphogluconate aldolase, partial [Sphingomonas sp. Root720]|uniref:bifunctional 4-hydroxy-2-oxoglutarate aldolase/2-dehydro-3-deoxy-phosphogluconate aldolase n=1 Tax=Sphingomonas sp. Root720 TaxID=1736595 RepID=UPI0006F66DA9